MHVQFDSQCGHFGAAVARNFTQSTQLFKLEPGDLTLTGPTQSSCRLLALPQEDLPAQG